RGRHESAVHPTSSCAWHTTRCRNRRQAVPAEESPRPSCDIPGTASGLCGKGRAQDTRAAGAQGIQGRTLSPRPDGHREGYDQSRGERSIVGLYLAVFEDDEELDGVEVGSYADFGVFRDTITQRLESRRPRARGPTLMTHSDCEGSWSTGDILHLEQELRDIAEGLRRLPPLDLKAGTWQGD